MFKKSLSIILFLNLILLQAYAQDSINFYANYQLTTRGQFVNLGIVANPQNQFQLSPFLIYGSTHELKNQSFGIGTKFAYSNELKTKKLRLYLLSNIQFSITPTSVQIDHFNEKILEHTFGYGLRLKILKRFYLFQEIGVGYQLGFPNPQIIGRESIFILPAGLFNIGIGYE